MTRTISDWIMSAPTHWTRGRIKNLLASSTNGTWGSDPVGDGTDVKCVRAADFDRVRQRVKKDYLPLRNIDRATLRHHRLNPGDLILEKSGGGDKQPVGMAVLFDHSEIAVCSNFCSRIVPSRDVDSRFLAYVFSAAYSQGLTESSIKQTTGIQNLDSRAFLSSPWAYPKKEEQQRIANFLDVETGRINRLHSLQEKLIERLEEREIAQLNGAIDELIYRFGTVPLRRFIWKVDQGISPQCDAIPASDGEWGVLKVSCLRPGVFIPEQNKRLPDKATPEKKAEVREGDLLITRANTPQLVGSTAVVHKVRSKLLLPDKIFRVRLTGQISPEFVATIARGSRIRSLCAATSNGASQSMANIRFEEIKSWPLPAVDQAGQSKFVDQISRSREQVDFLRPKIKNQLDLLTERRQALITAAVTGQFDVSTASGRGVDLS
ncbi:restriction endonuclease subunit S [Streptomyces sp. HB2AG]|uniref:restriction endonuclease subunit S n=1 Tax=Streptomyces sp. HB2AG TaxID=2983400 RepID=UPI0022AB2A04|nr:restriction endonuclease subunit S [Streptomyces sp. HB2AG]MCZ2525380.1 restriction endonuclease subunit S [Streptomyces sp. HB2AG]